MRSSVWRVVSDARLYTCVRTRREPQPQRRSIGRKPLYQAKNAPEWTRTPTDQMVHKALNPIHLASMGPLASKSSISRAFLDALDASGGTTFVRLLSRTGLWDRALDGNDCGGRRAANRQEIQSPTGLLRPMLALVPVIG
jgi:hypothetical protein